MGGQVRWGERIYVLAQLHVQFWFDACVVVKEEWSVVIADGGIVYGEVAIQNSLELL